MKVAYVVVMGQPLTSNASKKSARQVLRAYGSFSQAIRSGNPKDGVVLIPKRQSQKADPKNPKST